MHVQQLVIPNLAAMNEDGVKRWLSTLSTDEVYANYASINYALMKRFGNNARVSTSTYQAPKLVYLLDI